MWTVSLFSGFGVGKPKAKFALVFRILGGLVFMFIRVIVIAGATNILNDGLSDGAIRSFNELAGKTVCVNSQSSAVTSFLTKNTAVGYTIDDSYQTVDEMYGEFVESAPGSHLHSCYIT